MARGKKKESALTPEEKLAQALVPVEEQPYKVPDNWCWAKIGAISDFERGITFPASAKENEPSEENIPCLRTANVQENLEIDDLIYVNRSFMKGNTAKLVRENDIIMSSANSRELVGKASYVTHVPFPMTFGGFVLNIRARGISSKYLFYFLRQEFLAGKFMGESTQTTNIANINTATLGGYELPLPPLAEQQRIVDRIEYLFAKLDEAKEKAQSVLDSFETRKAAILHKAFIGELTAAIKDRSGEKLNIVFPYGAVYRMQNDGLIEEVSKQKAPDGRKRQYYRITEAGRSHLKDLLEAYQHFTQGVSAILAADQ
jgi:type I restriction enzyme S subunit